MRVMQVLHTSRVQFVVILVKLGMLNDIGIAAMGPQGNYFVNSLGLNLTNWVRRKAEVKRPRRSDLHRPWKGSLIITSREGIARQLESTSLLRWRP